MVTRMKNMGENKGKNDGPELSGSTVSGGNNPTLTLDTGRGNKQEIPLTKREENKGPKYTTISGGDEKRDKFRKDAKEDGRFSESEIDKMSKDMFGR